MKRRVVLWMLIVVCAFAVVVTASQAGPGQLAFEAARKRELIDHDLLGAIAQYSSIVAKYGADDRLVSEALLRLAGCQEQLGQPEARTTYERLVKEYPDTASARDAQKKLDAFGARGSGLTATQHGGQSTTGAPSFDGRFFTLEDLDTGDLAVTELKTGRTTRVTFNAGARPFQHVVSSVPSPDGTHIAYAWANDGVEELRVIETSGRRGRKLCCINGGYAVTPFGWSRDGKEILFSLATEAGGAWSTQLLITSAAGGPSRLLKTLQSKIKRAAWSPDGKFIIYDASRSVQLPHEYLRLLIPAPSPQHGLFIIRVGGSAAVALTPFDSSHEEMLDWFPDGQHILFMSDRSGANEIMSQRIAEGRLVGSPVFVTTIVGRVSGQGFTRNGAYYHSVQTVFEDVRAATTGRVDDSGVVVGRPEPLGDRFEGVKRDGVLSPDGRQLAYVETPRVKSAPPVLVIHPLQFDRTVPSFMPNLARGIPISLATIANPAWSPDGRSIFVEGTTVEGRQGLFRVELASGGVSPVGGTGTDRLRQRNFPAVSPDGRELFYVVDGGSGGIQARDLASGTVRTVLEVPVLSFALSPDGRFIAAGAPLRRSDADATPPLRIVSVAGGSTRALCNEHTAGNPGVGIAWSPDARYVWFTRYGGKPGRYIWRCPLSGGPAELTSLQTDDNSQIGRLSISANGRVAISTVKWINGNSILRNIPADKPAIRR